VEVLSGDAGEIGDAEKTVLASKADMTEKSRLSCQIRVNDDLHVEVVSQASVKGMEAGPRPTE
jgi:ferredoxin